MPLNPLFMTPISLATTFLDKVTGLPLSGGYAQFWQDDNRIFPKPVFELTGSPPNYTYTELPNPLFIGPSGQFVDNTGARIQVYAYPYDDFGNLELYYVTIFNDLNVPQYAVQAWPNEAAEIAPLEMGSSSADNTILNSQFGFVNFSGTQSFNSINGTATYQVAPGWQLVVTGSGAGTVTLTQNPIAGTNDYPGQPPYTMTVTSAGAVTGIILEQVMTGNPNIFSQDFNGQGGWVSTSILLAPLSQITIMYTPNFGLATQLLTANNAASGVFKEFNAIVQLPPGGNTNSGNASSTQIQLIIQPLTTCQFSNVQVVPSFNQPIAAPPYDQEPLIAQQGFLFGTYQNQLNYKPLNSYLVGWDFPKNPAQLGATFTAAGFAGNNASQYTWDQTILFQTVTQTMGVTRSASGDYVITSAGNGQVAVIQYLSDADVQEILSGNVSVNLSGYTDQVGGIAGTVSLWVSDGTALPVITGGTKPSLVGGLNAAGFPTSLNACTGAAVGWTQITRQNGLSSTFTLGTIQTNQPSKYNDIPLNAFGLSNAGALTSATAKFFAIVVGFAQLNNTKVITLNSISTVPGDIATRPAPKTIDATRRECNRYYYSTFQPGVVPADNVGINSGEFIFTCPYAGAVNNYSPTLFMPTAMRAIPGVTFYNPALGGGAGVSRNEDTAGDAASTLTTACNVSKTTLALVSVGVGAGPTAWAVGNRIGTHMTADARLGVV